METKICSFCGMEYPASDEKCPLCGHSDVLLTEDYVTDTEPAPRPARTQQNRSGRRTGARVAQSSPVPRWLVVLTCIVLALAVVIFVMFLLSYTGVFDKDAPDNSSLTLPVDDDNAASSGELTDDESATGDNNAADTTAQTVACTGLSLTKDVYTPDSVGDSFTLSAVVTPADCNEAIYWKSSDESICSVDEFGVVTVLSEGEDVTITAVCGNYTASCVIAVSQIGPMVSDPDAEHELNLTDITFFSAGESATLRLSNTLEGDVLVWESEDEGVASVNENGVVKAVNRGTVDVNVTINGIKTYTCIVRCGFAEIEDTNTAETGAYSISHKDVTLHYLEHETFRISLTDFDGTVYWTSSDTSVCTVSDGIVRAEGPGTASVSATVGGVTYSCIVRCME